MDEKQVKEIGKKYRRSKNYYEFCTRHGKTLEADKAKRDMEGAMRQLQQIRAEASKMGAHRKAARFYSNQ